MTRSVAIGVSVGAAITFFIPFHYLMIGVLTAAFFFPRYGVLLSLAPLLYFKLHYCLAMIFTNPTDTRPRSPIGSRSVRMLSSAIASLSHVVSGPGEGPPTCDLPALAVDVRRTRMKRAVLVVQNICF